jgi:hypothetical protein
MFVSLKSQAGIRCILFRVPVNLLTVLLPNADGSEGCFFRIQIISDLPSDENRNIGLHNYRNLHELFNYSSIDIH